jgi:hypothetical protein
MPMLYSSQPRDIVKHHDSIINRLVILIPQDNKTELFLNNGMESGNNLRPNIMKIDHNLKSACIIDVTCPFEKDANALQTAAKRKVQKYSNDASILGKQGYRVYVGGFVIGALGSWNAGNTATLHAIGIPKKFDKKGPPLVSTISRQTLIA